MDPTFGSQEILDSLSQASSRASKSSKGGSSNSTLTSAHTNPVEDAYRRIGQGLSQRAQGGGDNSHPGGGGGGAMPQQQRQQRARLGTHPYASFDKYQRPAKKPFNPHASLQQGSLGSQSGVGPSPKVAKLGGSFHDHAHQGYGDGQQPPKPSQRILKKITMQAKETFHKWRRQQKAGYVQKYGQEGKLSSSNGSHTQSGHTSAATSYTAASSYGRLTEQQLLLQQQQQQQMGGLPHNDPYHPNNYAQLTQQQQQLLLQQQQLQLLQQQQQQQQPLSSSVQSQGQGGQGPAPKGLLSAVLEGGSESTYESESVHSLPTINSQKTGMSVRTSNSQKFHQYPGPPGSSVPRNNQTIGGGGGGSSMLSSSLQMQQPSHNQHNNLPLEPALHYSTPRGRCLTLPAEPIGNDGLDNVEGNLLLFQNDIMVIPSVSQTKGPHHHTHHTMSSHANASPARGLEFHVQSLLGQGTFAQVFGCWESVSKKHVALKIIKNKPAFTKQAAVEIEVFRALAAKTTEGANKDGGDNNGHPPEDDPASGVGGSTPNSPHMVHLLSSFMYKNHLCLVFELLGLNLYEVLKRRQFRGLPLQMVRSLVLQGIEGVKELASKTIVHCDLKPENILLVGEEVEKEVVGAGEHSHKNNIKDMHMSSDASVVSVMSTSSTASRKGGGGNQAPPIPQTIKLIDFGSACFEGYSAHTYIQSRFYRSPEVLMGLPYDSAIDMWSLGCVAAELFLGLPILPGVHEHDQCGRITEMIGIIPDWMLESGSKATKYYLKYVPRNNATNSQGSGSGSGGSGGSVGGAPSNNDPMQRGNLNSNDPASQRPMMPQWRLKTQEEYIKSLTQNEIRKKGGLAKLEKQPANRYFKRTKLSDIIMLHGQQCVGDEKELLGMFVHFLYGILDPDPWKRWTAYQAAQHPFLTGAVGQLKKKGPDTKLDYKEENQANCNFDIYWVPPWDPGICRRKLLNVQKMREKQNDRRRGYGQARNHGVEPDRGAQQSPSMNSVNSNRGQPMMVADSPSVGHMSVDGGKSSPPSQIASKLALQNAQYARGGAASAASMPKGGLASSMSAVGNAGRQGQMGMENPVQTAHLMNAPSSASTQPRFLGPQSYTGHGYDDKPIEADFAYALQRPGNVPGLGMRDDATVTSQASLGSSHAGLSVNSNPHLGGHQQQRHMQQQQQQQQQYGSHRGMSQNSMPRYQQNQVTNVSSLPSSAAYPNQSAGMLGAGGVSYQGYGGAGGPSSLSSSGFEQQGGVQYLAAQQRAQKERARGQQQQPQQQPPQQFGGMGGEVMSQAHHELLIKQQQEQLAALQQQHQAQLAALQQQQQMAFQQQQQQFMNQYGQTGNNGYYYVTSADGTPMLMQQGGGGGGGGGHPGGHNPGPMGASYDGSAAGPGGGYMMPPQQQQQQPGSLRDRNSGRRPSGGQGQGRSYGR